MSNCSNRATVALALPDRVLTNFMLRLSQDGPTAKTLSGKIGTAFFMLTGRCLANPINILLSETSTAFGFSLQQITL